MQELAIAQLVADCKDKDLQFLGQSCATAFRFRNDYVVRVSPFWWDGDRNKIERAKRLLDRNNWSRMRHLPRIYKLHVTDDWITTIMPYYTRLIPGDANTKLAVDFDEVSAVPMEQFCSDLARESMTILGTNVSDAHHWNIGFDKNFVPVVFDFWI